MRVLITGGAGFIGSQVADALLANGHEVAVLDNLATGARKNVASAAHFFQEDVRDASAVERVFAEFRPEVVNHQAAQTSVAVSARDPAGDADVNILGSLRLIDGSVRHDVKRFVFASTGGAIYGEVPDGEQAGVGSPERPLNPYGCAKLAVEHYLTAFAHEHGLEHRILRYANVYGPRQDPHGEAGVVAIFLERLLANRSIRVNARKENGDDGCIRDYVYVGDVVAANVRATQGELAARITDVGSGHATTTRALADTMRRALGTPAEVGFGPRRAGDVERSVLRPDPSLPPPTPLARGLEETVAWFKSREAKT